MTVRLSLLRNTITVDGEIRSFSRHQVTLLWLLMCHREVSTEMMVEALWPNPHHMPDSWQVALRIQLHCLRNNLFGTGWVIKTLGRSRWSLDRSPAVALWRAA